MKIQSVLIGLAALFLVSHSLAGDVRDLCEKTDLQVLDLKYRDRTGNRAIIKSTKLVSRRTGQFNFLREQKKGSVNDGNEKFIAASKLKESFAKFATEKQKRADPIGYRATLLEIANALLPRELNHFDWFLNLKLPAITATEIRPARESELGEIYGAIFRPIPISPNSESLEVVFSNNESESVPYLVPLLVHELKHAFDHVNSIGKRKNVEEAPSIDDLIIGEAAAFDEQMKAYVALVRREPELFCNWMHVTQSYGDLIVPLSWVMNSMEVGMRSGTFIRDYAKIGVYSKYTKLLTKDKSALRPDIQKRITDLKLQYVK